MSETPSWQELIQLVEQLNGSDYESASVQFGDVSVRLSKSADVSTPLNEHSSPVERAQRVETTSLNEHSSPVERAQRVETTAPSVSTPLNAHGTTIDAPMVGVFYRRPAPGAEPFVQPGDLVEPDTTIGIVEIMKLMNPVSAGVAGVLGEFLVDDGAAVEFGQALVSVQPSA